MLGIFYGYAFALITAIVVIAGDVSLKIAADSGQTLISRPALLGAGLYVLSAAMWFFAMRHVTLAQAGVAYSMLSLIALCAIGASHFEEEFRAREAAGIACALLAMILLIRSQD